MDWNGQAMVILDAVSQSSELFVLPYDSEQTAGATTNKWIGVIGQMAVKLMQNEIYKREETFSA